MREESVTRVLAPALLALLILYELYTRRVGAGTRRSRHRADPCRRGPGAPDTACPNRSARSATRT